MKKNKLLLGLSAAALGLALVSCGGDTPAQSGGASTGGNTPEANPLAGTYDATVWVSEVSGVKELTQTQIDKFEEKNPGIVINATVEGIGEGDAATKMIADVENGADVFCFAQDQLSRLVQAHALNPLGVKASEKVREANDAGSIAAATVGDKLYCYPLTSDNGYFMYYDKSVIKESSLDSLEAIIKDCEDADRGLSFEIETNTWYNAAFFFATGCKSEWQVNTEGEFIGVNDTFNSANGLAALRGMQKVLKSTAFVNSSNTADFAAAIPSAVVISGVWGGAAAKDALGENLGATDLPSFKDGDKEYHLTSFAGNKLMGVKPQEDPKKAAVLQQLALYLTGEDCQVERYTAPGIGWGPSNKAAQATDAVKNDLLLSALNLQNQHSVVQGQAHGSWWDFGKNYAAAAKKATTDADLQKALDDYTTAMNGIFTMSDDVKNAWTLIGIVDWNTDTEMTKLNDNTWCSKTAIEFTAGQTFKCRKGKNWDTNIGGTGKDGNFEVKEACTKWVKLVVNADGKTGTITLEDTQPTA